MELLVTLTLAGLLAARELLRAFQGPNEANSPALRWIDPATYVFMAAFFVLIALRVARIFTGG
jgi:hypothetical protein